MAEASLDLAKAVRARLVAASAVTALVPAISIRDSSGLPTRFPSILIGDAQTTPGGDIARRHHEVYSDLHVWAEEVGVETVTKIGGVIRDALTDGRWTFDHFHVADLRIASSRFLHDPDGKHGHGVISLQAVVVEVV